jgi:hypothetical protein
MATVKVRWDGEEVLAYFMGRVVSLANANRSKQRVWLIRDAHQPGYDQMNDPNSQINQCMIICSNYITDKSL